LAAHAAARATHLSQPAVTQAIAHGPRHGTLVALFRKHGQRLADAALTSRLA
jgi:hypothetical protein